MWKQRSRNFWLTERDRNTSFFHTKAINRKQRNTIHGLCDANGDWQKDDFQIEQITMDYFSNIFCSQGPTDATTLIYDVDPVVSTHINNFLTQEFIAEEVHRALKQMHPKNLIALMVCLLSFISTFGLWLVIVLQILYSIFLIIALPPQSLTKPIFAQPKSKKPKKDYPILTHQS